MAVNSRSEYDACDVPGATRVRCACILARVSAGSEAISSSTTRSCRRRGLGSVQVFQTAGVSCATAVTGGRHEAANARNWRTRCAYCSQVAALPQVPLADAHQAKAAASSRLNTSGPGPPRKS